MSVSKNRHEADLERLKVILAAYPDIQAVYLFGSAATGRQRPESDLDLAIVARTSALRARQLGQ